MADVEIFISVNNDRTFEPNLWGLVIDTYALGQPGTMQEPILWFFIMAHMEILISVDSDRMLDPNLWGVRNWHLRSRTTRDCARPNFVIFHNGQRQNFDFHQQQWNAWPKLVGVSNWHLSSKTTRDHARPNFVIFHNNRCGNFDFRWQWWNTWPKLVGGLIIDTYALRPPGTMPDPILWFFIMVNREISISIDNDGMLDPNLWGVGNWHLCSRTTKDHARPSFVIFFIMADMEILISTNNDDTHVMNCYAVCERHLSHMGIDYCVCECPLHTWRTATLYSRGLQATRE